MNERINNLAREATAKAKFRELKREAFLIGNYEFCQAVNKLLNCAELNAAKTDFAQDDKAVDENYWTTVIGSISDLLACSDQMAIRNWFALHGIFG
jgi:hypothetical protein